MERRISLKNYTLRYLSVSFLVIIAIWAALFYAYILDEVYDNVDDGLKNQKIEILREAYKNPETLKISEYGVNQFKITPVSEAEFSEENVLSREFFYMPYDEEDEPYRVLRTGFHAADGMPYHLEIRTSTVEEDDLVYDLATALVVLYLVLVFSLYLINNLVLRRAWRPFKVIIDNLNHYRFGKKEDLMPVETNVKEFNTLYDEINDMWQRNEAVFDEQKRFIENASHELQTPLAITINKLELLMEDEGLNESQLIQIGESRAALMRMISLNKSLLMLSRISNKQYAAVELVNFNDVVQDLQSDFQEMMDFKEIDFAIDDQGSFALEMNPDLARVLLSNLLRNAIKYTERGGRIHISIGSDAIAVANTAQGDALDAERLFRRFYKGEQDNHSNGLGLAIVSSIVEAQPALAISYSFTNNNHVFLLRK